MRLFKSGLIVFVLVLGVVFGPGMVRDAAAQSTGSGVNVYAGPPSRSGPFVAATATITRYAGSPRGSYVDAKVALYRQSRTGSFVYDLRGSKGFRLAAGRRRTSATLFVGCTGVARQVGWYALVRARVMVGTRVVRTLEHTSAVVDMRCR